VGSGEQENGEDGEDTNWVLEGHGGGRGWRELVCLCFVWSLMSFDK